MSLPFGAATDAASEGVINEDIEGPVTPIAGHERSADRSGRELQHDQACTQR
jgi:hypothetical protein